MTANTYIINAHNTVLIHHFSHDVRMIIIQNHEEIHGILQLIVGIYQHIRTFCTYAGNTSPR